MGKQYNLVDFGADSGAAARAVFRLKILNAFMHAFTRATELDVRVTTE
jgi:hypothetical protein